MFVLAVAASNLARDMISLQHTILQSNPEHLGFSCFGVGEFVILLLFLENEPEYSGFSSLAKV